MSYIHNDAKDDEEEKQWAPTIFLRGGGRGTKSTDLPAPLLKTDKDLYSKAIIPSTYGMSYLSLLSKWSGSSRKFKANWGNPSLSTTFSRDPEGYVDFFMTEYRVNSPAKGGKAREQYAFVAAGIDWLERGGDQEQKILHEGSRKGSK